MKISALHHTFCQLLRKTLAAACLLSLVLVVRPAQADNMGGMLDGAFQSYVTAFIVGSTIIGVSGVALGTYQGIKSSAGERTHLGWTITTYAVGGLNLALGSLMLASNNGDAGFIVLGSSFAVLGAADIGLTLWNSTLPRQERPLNVSLVPQLLLDSKGNPTMGAGVQVVGF